MAPNKPSSNTKTKKDDGNDSGEASGITRNETKKTHENVVATEKKKTTIFQKVHLL